MKKAFVATVYNEESNVKKFIESLKSQTLLPDEVVIVDAFSKDKTYEIIENLLSNFPNKVKILKKNGNRSVGRNYAIENTSSDIIAVSDFGCILKKDWFEKITSPLVLNRADVVAGFYKPVTRGPFQKSLATYTCVPSDKVNADFLPSSRSIAFLKSAWKNAKGYPEHLDTCEDLVFAKKLKKLGMRFLVVKSAIVHWPQRENILQAAKQFYSYAHGDGAAGYIRFQTYFLFGRYILAGVLLITGNLNILIALIFLYVFWAIWKNYRYSGNMKSFVYLPMLQLVSDITVILGTVIGRISVLKLSSHLF